MTMPFPSGLVVSCQALDDEPLFGSDTMAKMAYAAKLGGAVAIRANTPNDIRAIRSAVRLPVIGIYKVQYPESSVYITPTLREVDAVLASGCEIISLDATRRMRPKGESLADLVTHIRSRARMCMADVSTLEEALRAESLGFDMVSTTLSGYTEATQARRLPDLDLVAQIVEHVRIPVLAEGHIATHQDFIECFARGAYAVVIGSAITRPQVITARYVEAFHTWKQTLKMS